MENDPDSHAVIICAASGRAPPQLSLASNRSSISASLTMASLEESLAF